MKRLALLAAAMSCGCESSLDLLIDGDCNPLAVTTECLPPMPSRTLMVRDASTVTGLRLNYPESGLEVPDYARPISPAPFNRADGASPSAPAIVHFGVDVDPRYLFGLNQYAQSLVDGAPIALFDMDDGVKVPVLVEMDQNLRFEENQGRHALLIRPMRPLEPAHRHAVVITTTVTDVEGRPLPDSPGFVALRDRLSTVHGSIEDLRQPFEELFTFLDRHGYARDELHLAWDFVTASRAHLFGPILSMRETALADAAARAFTYTVTSVDVDPNPSLSAIILGDFQVPTFLNDLNEIELDPDGKPIRMPDQTFPFTIIVPKKAHMRTDLPLVMFGHGIFGEGRRYLTGGLGDEIQPIAEEAGAIVVATDWIGLSGGDLNLVIAHVIPDLNRIRLVTDRLQQSIINNVFLTELALHALGTDPDFFVDGRAVVDPDRVYYYGVSLGGIQGSSFVSVSPRISRATLGVPGSAWSTMLTRSWVYKPIKEFVDLTYPDPLIQQQFIAMLQSAFDHSDPFALTRMLYKEPLPDAPAERLVVLQEAVGDCQVPNISSRMLARAIGAGLMGPVVEPVWGLEEVSGPTRQPVLAQILMVDEVEAYRPPTTNTLPTEDNGVHSDANLLQPAKDQLLHLMSAGEIDEFCNGLCDPD